MKNSATPKKLKPSVLSCLLDDEPEKSGDHPFESIRKETFIESVREDLIHLFTSRASVIHSKRYQSEHGISLFNYGLPDIGSVNLDSKEETENYCDAIARAIETFEPRLRNVEVEAQNGPDAADDTFHFRIKATLYYALGMETLVFDSEHNTITQSINISEVHE